MREREGERKKGEGREEGLDVEIVNLACSCPDVIRLQSEIQEIEKEYESKQKQVLSTECL